MSRRHKKAPGFEFWLGNSVLPVFVLDAERRIVAFNAGCEALTGWAAEEILGQTCRYTSALEVTGPEALAASLCPPIEVFAGDAVAAPAYLLHKDGRALPRLLQFFPWRDESGTHGGVAGIVQPLPAPRALGEVSPARRLHAELAALRASLRTRFSAQSLVAECVTMRKVVAQADLAQQTSGCVLICGEHGTGKEHLARAIHFGSQNQRQWFVPLDCRRLGADELERVWQRLMEVHHAPATNAAAPLPGTVYLAEVEYLPRELQERVVRALASDDSRPRPSLRLLAAIERDPQAAARDQRLRADFLALVSPLTIQLPPLRDRGDDLPLLAQHFLEELNRHDAKQSSGFDEAVWPLLRRYDWPGNLDELLAVVREAQAAAAEPLIRAHDLPYRFRNALDAQLLPPAPSPLQVPLETLLARLETRLIELALARAKQNKSKAAELLGMPRARLLRRIEQLRLANGRPPEPTESVIELTEELLQEERPEG